MEGGPPRFRQDSTCPVLLRIQTQFHRFRIRDFHSLWCDFPDTSSSNFPLMSVLQPQCARTLVWAIVCSLAATYTISIDFSSWRYLDVSVPSVRSTQASFSLVSNYVLTQLGCPIRKSPGQSMFNNSPKLIAVFPRPSSPLTAKVSTVCP